MDEVNYASEQYRRMVNNARNVKMSEITKQIALQNDKKIKSPKQEKRNKSLKRSNSSRALDNANNENVPES